VFALRQQGALRILKHYLVIIFLALLPSEQFQFHNHGHSHQVWKAEKVLAIKKLYTGIVELRDLSNDRGRANPNHVADELIVTND
jgi:hypothetical protein